MQKEVKIFGKKLMLNMRNDGDDAVANELFLDHQYRYCDKAIQSAKNTIIDIGGHLGFFSLYASILNSKVPIYSFEPFSGNFSILKKNLKDNRIKNVTAKNLAVWSKNGTIDLILSKEDLNHSLVHAIEDRGEVEKVQSITLEKIFDRHRISQCDLLKIDCEGAEFAILESTPNIIFDKTSNIFIEYHDWTPGKNHKDLKRLIESHHFKVEDYPNSKMKELGFLWCTKF